MWFFGQKVTTVIRCSQDQISTKKVVFIKSAFKSGIKIHHLLLPSLFLCSPGAKYFPYKWHEVGGRWYIFSTLQSCSIDYSNRTSKKNLQKIQLQYQLCSDYVTSVSPSHYHHNWIYNFYWKWLLLLVLLLGMSEMMAKYITSVELPNSIQKYHSFLLVHSTLRLDSSLLSLAG